MSAGDEGLLRNVTPRCSPSCCPGCWRRRWPPPARNGNGNGPPTTTPGGRGRRAVPDHAARAAGAGAAVARCTGPRRWRLPTGEPPAVARRTAPPGPEPGDTPTSSGHDPAADADSTPSCAAWPAGSRTLATGC
jgi:hypothetical protein